MVLRVDTSPVSVAQRIDYDPWGAPTFVTGGETVQPFGYAGSIWLNHARFWHMGARDYDPAIGRWTSKDPIRFGGGMNLYEYAGGDPVNFVDVTGLWAIGGGFFIGAGIGAEPTFAGGLWLGSGPNGLRGGGWTSLGIEAGVIAEFGWGGTLWGSTHEIEDVRGDATTFTVGGGEGVCGAVTVGYPKGEGNILERLRHWAHQIDMGVPPVTWQVSVGPGAGSPVHGSGGNTRTWVWEF